MKKLHIVNKRDGLITFINMKKLHIVNKRDGLIVITYLMKSCVLFLIRL